MNNMMFLIIMWCAAALFLGIGIYIRGRKTPVRIWTTTAVKADDVSDIPSYNRAVGRMWSLIAPLLFVIGIVEFLYPAAAVVVFCLICIPGIPGMIWYAHKIEEKYKAG